MQPWEYGTTWGDARPEGLPLTSWFDPSEGASHLSDAPDLPGSLASLASLDTGDDTLLADLRPRSLDVSHIRTQTARQSHSYAIVIAGSGSGRDGGPLISRRATMSHSPSGAVAFGFGPIGPTAKRPVSLLPSDSGEARHTHRRSSDFDWAYA
jgi:hypothetical protein